MSKKISLSEPIFFGNEKKYLNDCIDSGWVSSAGSFVDKFEESIAEYTGVKNAISIVNGTSTIHLALKIAGVQSGHEVIAPTLTFIAPINAISYLGAKPVFMDSDPFFNIDIEKTIMLVKKYFGALEPKDLPVYQQPFEEPIIGVREGKVTGPNAEMMVFAYRFEDTIQKDL